MSNKHNTIKPVSPKVLVDDYKNLREPDPERDKDYSPLADGIMSAVSKNLNEHCPSAFSEVWTTSMFPERITKEILRLVEQHIERDEQG